MVASWAKQFRATLHRNILIKIRDGSQSLQEVLLPVYIIILLIIVKLIQPEVDEPGVLLQPQVDAACSPVTIGGPSGCWEFTRTIPTTNILAYSPRGNKALDELVTRATAEINDQSYASTSFQLFAAMYMVWALAPLMQVTLTHIVNEKESLLKDCMLVMGLRESVYWLCWLLTYALMAALTSLVIAVAAQATTLFSHSSMSAVLAVLYPYALSLIAMALALSTVFSQTQMAVGVASLLMLLGSVAILPIDLLRWPSAVCLPLTLFSPVGLAMAVDVIAKGEANGDGLHLHSLWSTRVGVDPGDADNPLSVGAIVCVFALDTLLYLVLAWYLDNVWAHPERGPKRPWNFVLQRHYWWPSSSASARYTSMTRQLSLDDEMDDDALGQQEGGEQEEHDPDMEAVGPQLRRRAAVVLTGLRKVYPRAQQHWWQVLGGKCIRRKRPSASPSAGYGGGGGSRRADKDVEAVKGLSLTLYEGQTFAFLGHSGSGKTAVLSMLAGLSQPSGGEAYIYGHRTLPGSLVGVCPQHNVGLAFLTPREQLRFFMAIKGDSTPHLGRNAAAAAAGEQARPQGQGQGRAREDPVEAILAEMGMHAHDADRAAFLLAPAEQRKLSLAIALVGNPQAEELGVEGGALEATTLEEVFAKLQDEGEEEAATVGWQPFGNGSSTLDAEDWTAQPLRAVSADEDEVLLASNDSTPAGVMPEVKKKPLFWNQTTVFTHTRLALYRRNMSSTVSAFGMPLIFAVVALVIQAAYRQPSPARLALRDGSIAHSAPLLYTAQAAQKAAAQAVVDLLGSNHAFLARPQLEARFEGDPANVERNAGGSTGVGVVFDELDIAKCTAKYTVLYQPWHIHQLPSVTAMLDNAIFQAIRGTAAAAAAGAPAALEVESHPLPHEDLGFLMGYFVAAVVAVGLLMVPPILAAQVVVDRELGMRARLNASGLTGGAFWLATFFTDWAMYGGVALLILGTGLAIGHSPFTSGAAPALLALLAAAVPALTLLAYVLSFSKASSQAAASSLSLLLLLAAVVPYAVITANANSSGPGAAHTLFAFIDPPYALIAGLHYIADADITAREQNGAAPSGATAVARFLRWGSHVPVCILGLAVSAVLLALRLCVLERRAFDPAARRADHLTGEAPSGGEAGGAGGGGEDVRRERERVLESAARWDGQGLVGDSGDEGDLIICSAMGKNFGAAGGVCGIGRDDGHWALRNLWLGVARGEMVVLLGGSRAGKSTALECLAGALPLSYGDALLCGLSVRFSYLPDCSSFSYCPQAEVLYGSLTVREHLQLFAAARGLPAPHSAAVSDAMVAFKLTEDADVAAAECKARTLRRLSIALASLGSPPVLLLDEPTQGMDVASRREVWARLRAESGNRATLICTHSVEEAEALGSRIGILVDGELKCLGSPQDLKRRYGSTYTLLVSAAPHRLPAIREFITTLFPTPPEDDDDALLSDISMEAVPQSLDVEEGDADSSVGSSGQAKLRVPVEGLPQLAMLLHELETKRASLGIEDYIVSQPTLQQVFYKLSCEDGNHRLRAVSA
eukprot:jgi/Mesen1/4816/ME000243S03991